MAKRGEISQATVDKWEKETGKKKLPKRIKKKATKSRKKKKSHTKRK